MFGKALLVGSVSALALMSGAAFAQTDQALETVVVTGIRASIAQGLDIKRESTQVVESVIAEDIGKLPDNNVVEALQRLTGVQVTNRGSGQVGTIYIRGLGDIETTWNGRKLFTSSGLYYSVQDMPATLVRRLDVYKTRAADQLETGIAGQIDVQSYRPFDFDGFKLSGQVQGTYEDKRGAVDPSIGLLVSNRWKTSIGDIGVLANLSWSVVRFRDESSAPGALVPFATETPPSATGLTPLQRIFNPSSGTLYWTPGLVAGLSEESGATMSINGTTTPYYLSRDAIFQSDFTGKRTRPNANLAIQWAPSENSTYTLEVMYNGFRNQTYNNLLFTFVDYWSSYAGTSPTIAPATAFTLYPGTNIMKTRTTGPQYGFNSGDETVSKTNSYVYALNAKWNLTDRFRASADLSYQASQYNTQFFAMRIWRWSEGVNVDFNAGGGIMAFNFGDYQSELSDPSYWTTGQIYDNANHNKGDAYTLQVDGIYDLKGLLGPLTDVKFGVRYDSRNAAQSYRTDSTYYGEALTNLDSGYLHYTQNFFEGVAAVPHTWVNIDGPYLWKHRADIRTLYGLTPSATINSFWLSERTTEVYGELDGEHDLFGRPLAVNVGLRWVQVADPMSFYDTVNLVTDHDHAYVAKFLPSATVSYELTDDIKLRANYGETLRRPTFTDLNPTYTLNADVTSVGYATGTRGNPALKPTHAKNIDLTAEWYFAASSAIYGTLFQRDLENIVVSENVARTISGSDILAKYNTNNFIIYQPMNASSGSLKGIELGAVYFPDFLPSYLDGFGVQGSLTILTSSQMTPETDATTGEVVSYTKEAMFGVSPMSYNTTLIYEKNNIGARVSYVWRSKFHYTNEAASFANPLGIWRRAEASLDFQLNYKPWEGVMVTFDGTNMLNGKQKQYYHSGGQGDPEVTNFGTALFSRTFTIGLHYSTN